MARVSRWFHRREFLVMLGAGAPLLISGCDDAESTILRSGGVPLPALAPHPGWHGAVDVRKPVASQTLDDRTCSVPASLPLAVGDQVRITRSAGEQAIYTVGQKREQDDPYDVRMRLEARQRVGSSKEFEAMLSMPVVDTILTDAQAEAADEFVERLVDDGSNTGLVVLAPHGGTIEFNTDRQAEIVTAALGCSSWICKGWKATGGAYECWHVTSSLVSPRSFPGLGMIADRGFAYAVSFHGMSEPGVRIGGRAPIEVRSMLRQAIKDALSDPKIPVQLASGAYEGDNPCNVNNWLTLDGAGGVQIEQSQHVRTHHWEEVAVAVAGLFALLV